ncbi:outer membrane beta-barrel protein [Christiangramia sp. SM2212]|uniref:Outer membrane beta-barrel protein n=1 Tax=Christiangramia sediminicola TaxID=3073267 RepID=A0ABU1ESQ7_9FLAO|nr:outer membrane beta-barrel protein [Christiangramia sp. SM2212]MDR5591411.1 outer membrane beta-barrel protein [Christiangramia sp. SM2212]
MWLNIKLILLFSLLGFSRLSAQEKPDSISTKTEKYNRFLVYAGVNRNFSTGDGFISDAYDLSFGGELGLDFMITKNLLIGFQFDLLKATATKPEDLAGVQETKIISSSLHLGYKYYFSNLLFLNLTGGFGHARYSNKASFGRKFHDDAFFLYAKPKLGYTFDENWSFYLAAAIRNDKLRIETTPDFEDYFDNSTRIPISLGIQLGF